MDRSAILFDALYCPQGNSKSLFELARHSTILILKIPDFLLVFWCVNQNRTMIVGCYHYFIVLLLLLYFQSFISSRRRLQIEIKWGVFLIFIFLFEIQFCMCTKLNYLERVFYIQVQALFLSPYQVKVKTSPLYLEEDVC